MRYAIFSDVHANLRAWENVLEDVRDERADVLVCLGDVVGYGPKPEEVLRGVREATSNFVMGNHDAAAAGAMDYSIFNEQARHSIDWTKAALSAESKKFLAEVPLAIETEEIQFVHAEISEPGRFGYIDDLDKAKANFADSEHFVTFVGHTHHPNIYQIDAGGSVSELPGESRSLEASNRYVVNVGSVGEPRNFDDLRGVYVIYDSESRAVEFRRVEFDIAAYARDLASTTLGVKPFFLQSYEFKRAETQVARPAAAVALSMEAPAAATPLIVRSSAPVTLNLQQHPYCGGAKRSTGRGVLALTVFGVLAAIAALVWMLNDEAEQIVLEPKPKKAMPAPTFEPDPLPPTENPDPPKVVTAAKKPPPKKRPPRKNRPANPPKPPPATPAPEPEPEPKPVRREGSVVAWWRMDGNAASGELAADGGGLVLPMVKPGDAIRPLAPEEIPANGANNSGALSIGVWSEPKPSGDFALTPRRSFTLEGWVVTARSRAPIFLAGTRSGDANAKQGWHLDIRRPGKMCFFYDNGPGAIQALSETLPVGDLKPHHFAAVWDHDKADAAGRMRLYFDGELVAAAEVPHSGIPSEQANPFRIGSPTNPPKVGLDEVRFVHSALGPLEFLRAEAQSMIKSGKWTDSSLWSGGETPSGAAGAIIGPGVAAEAGGTPPEFSGDLVLSEGARLTTSSFEAFGAVVPTAPSKLVLEAGARFLITAGTGRKGGETKFGPIEVAGDAKIWGGRSVSGHHTKRSFSGVVTGPGALTLDGVNNNEFVFRTDNPFDGGLIIKSTQKQGFRVRGKVPGSLGKGDVEVGAHATLRLQGEKAIAPGATLTLSGTKDSRSASKVIIDENNAVSKLIFGGEEQEAGTWGAEGSGADNEHELFSGEGVLKVGP